MRDAATSQFSLDDRVALVTGAGSGLGRQFAISLATAGATVVLAARRREKLEETASIIEGEGGSAVCIALDVTKRRSVDDCFTKTIETVGIPQVVVNNAGIASQSYLTETEDAEWDAVLDTNLRGVFLVGQAAAKALMGARQPGSIINIASILGLRVSKTLAAYAAAKSAVIQLTKTMALEWAEFGIRVNAIAPGYFVTEMNEAAFAAGMDEQIKKSVPMRRVGQPHELAGAILLLASDAGSFMTGSTVTVDGGHVCNSL